MWRRTPAVPLALALALGVLAGESLHGSLGVVVTFAAVAAWIAVLVSSRRPSHDTAAPIAWSLALAAMFLTGAARLQPILDERDHAVLLAGLLEQRDAPVVWTGRVVDTRRYGDELVLTLAGLVEAPNPNATRIALPGFSNVALRQLLADAPVAPGDLVLVDVGLRRALDRGGPGVLQGFASISRRDAARIYFSGSAHRIELLDTPRDAQWLATAPRRLRDSLSAPIRRVLADWPQAASVVGAMTFAHEDDLSPEMMQDYARTGLIHILSVSGLHVSLVALLTAFVLRAVGLSRRRTILAIILVLPIYTLICGAAAPMRRAALMGLLFLVPRRWGWRIAPTTTLAISAIVLLLATPEALFQRSFQLSMMGMIGLVVLAPRATTAFALPADVYDTLGRPARCLQYGWIAILGGVCVTLSLAPLLAEFNGQVPLLGQLGNLPAIPLSTALVGAGVGGALLHPLAPPLAEPLIVLAGAIAVVQNTLVAWLSSMPLTSVAAAPMSPFAATLYWLVVLAPPWPPIERRTPWTHLDLRAHFLLRTLGAALIVALSGLSSPRFSDVPVELVFFDVGQGDATLIIMPSGTTILIDAGPPRPDFARANILPFLRARGIGRLDIVIASHGDADHIGGLPTILDAMPVNFLFEAEPPRDAPTEPLRRFSMAARTAKKRAYIGHGTTIEDGTGASVQVLFPGGTSFEPEESNDWSVVALVDYGDSEALLMADAPMASEVALLEGGWLGDVELLKAGHHGSNTSGDDEFLAAVRPESIVVSVGRNNRYHLPNPKAMARYAETGAEIWRTDERGTVRFLMTRERCWEVPLTR